MKNWFTNSTASMPNSFLAFAGKSRLSSFPPLSARCSDHSANEILKNRSALASPVTRESADCWLPFELDPPMQLTREAGNIPPVPASRRSEEHTSELQSLMRISYAVFCLNKKKVAPPNYTTYHTKTKTN